MCTCGMDIATQQATPAVQSRASSSPEGRCSECGALPPGSEIEAILFDRTATRVFNDLKPANGENLAAIDGLYEWQGQLIGVQNVTTPGRVIVVSLSKDGSTVEQVKTLLSHHHNALDEPTTGAIGRDGFYLLAATGVSRFNRDGKIERPESLPAPTVLRIPLPR